MSNGKSQNGVKKHQFSIASKDDEDEVIKISGQSKKLNKNKNKKRKHREEVSNGNGHSNGELKKRVKFDLQQNQSRGNFLKIFLIFIIRVLHLRESCHTESP